MKYAWVALAAFLSSACRTPSETPHESFTVELSGCAAMRAGPVCELPADREIRVFVRAPTKDTTFTSAEATVIREIEDGALYRMIAAPGASAFTVSMRGSKRSFSVAPRAAPAWLDVAKQLRQKGDTAGALAITDANANDYAFAIGLRARIELASGNVEAALPHFRKAIEHHRGAGRVSDAADDSFALAFALNQRSHRYGEARAVLDAVRSDIREYPDGRVREDYYRGQLSTEVGDAREALRLLESARNGARRLGLAQLERNAINAYALQLEMLGRTREALDLLANLGGETPCEKAEIAINVGYGALLVNEREGRVVVDAVAPLERALAAGCSDTYLAVAATSNLAFALLQRGDVDAARDRLASSSKTTRATETLFVRDVEGRIALARGDSKSALTAFDEEARLASTVLSFEATWRAEVGRGEALEKLGRNDAALAAYAKAEDVLADVSFLVPLGEGRGAFLGDRSRSARYAIDLAARTGGHAEALVRARLSRARIVAGLARSARLDALGPGERERWESALGAYREKRAEIDAAAKEDWKLPHEEAAKAKRERASSEAALRRALDDALAVVGARRPLLPDLPRDATTLAFHPVREGWIAIVADDQGVASAVVRSAAAADLVAPFRTRIERAKRIRVLAYGALRSTDFHALFRERTIEYPLDLVASAPRPEAAGNRAALVFDPTLDLRSTHREGDAVSTALRENGWTVESLEGARATSSAVLPLLGQVRLFHYAGHGVFGGREAMESFLPLAGGTHLTVADVLAAAAVPARVVLSGCETARASADSDVESLGMAQVFVLAGADFVVAPTRPVDDALAARMSKALYGDLARAGAADAATALRDAARALRAESPALDWDAFRVLAR